MLAVELDDELPPLKAKRLPDILQHESTLPGRPGRKQKRPVPLLGARLGGTGRTLGR